MIPSFNRQRLLLVLGDVALMLLATQLAPLIRFGRIFEIFFIHTGASTFTIILYMVTLYILDLYHIDRNFRSRDSALRMVVAIGAAGFFSTFLFYSFPQWKYGRGILFIQMILIWVLVTGWRWLYSVIYPVAMEKKDVLVLGAGECAMTLCRLLESAVSPFRVVGFLDDDPAMKGKTIGSPRVLGTMDQLTEIAAQKGVKTAILAITHDRPSRLIQRILDAKFKGIITLEMPSVYESLTGRVPVQHIRDEWLLFAEGFYVISKEYLQKIKRLIDLVVSSLLLVVNLPFMAVAALAIKLESPGPVFFKQYRVGKGGAVFAVWKFRSMRQGAEENGAVWADKNDSRVTRVGRWVRLLRIDELPQIYNIFRGEMSLIDPRPERPEFVHELREKIPYYETRHAVRPGITGWAQVNYPYGASVEDALHKLEYDLYYIKNMSLFLDLKIMLKTIGVVLFGEGAR